MILNLNSFHQSKDIIILIPREDIVYRYERVINLIKEIECEYDILFQERKKLIKYLFFYLIKRNKLELIKDFLFKYKLNLKKFLKNYLVYFLDEKVNKILIQFSDAGNCEFYFNLKNHLEKQNKYLINISHSISGKSEYFNQLNFSYYLVFGDLSINNLKENPFTVGETKVIKVGSLFYDKNLLKYKKNFSKKEKYNIMYTSSWIDSKKEWGKHQLNNFNIFNNFIKKYNDKFNIYVKLHPLENHSYWEDLKKEGYNFNIIKKNISWYEIIRNYDIDIHITGWSNSVIEFSLVNTPSIVLGNNEKFDDYELHKWFDRALNEEDLLNKIYEILNNYNFYQSKCSIFLQHALSNIGKEEEVLKELLIKLLNSKENEIKFSEIIKGNSQCAE